MPSQRMVGGRWHLGGISVGLILLLVGCGQNDGIRTYSVPQEERPASAARQPVAAAGEAWFFKLTGPRDAVLRQLVPFSGLLRSFQFTGAGQPMYQVPEGWTRSSGPPPRFETLGIPETNPALEVTVSSLPGPDRDVMAFLRANLNRWRGQLGLEPMPETGWMEAARNAGELVVIPTATKVIAFANLSGTTKEFGESRMLAGIVVPQSDAASAVDTPDPAFTYHLPGGWKVSPGSSMRLASFAAEHESGVVDISVTRFPGGGDDLANINRWRDQVKLGAIDAAELEKSSEKLPIGGRDGLYTAAVGPEQAILAAIVPDGDAKWFFKVIGPAAAVTAETEHFREFLNSVKFGR